MLANFVQETCNAPGTAATINLGGAASGRLPFIPTFASGSSVFYGMDDGTAAEMGIGVVTAGAPNTLTRTTVLWNSAGTTERLNFLGTVRVYNAVPAERVVALTPDAAAARATLGAAAASEFVGQVAYFVGTSAPAGWVKANGAQLSRTTFAALWAHAQAAGALVTDAQWLAGHTGAFSSGDGGTTFRLPDLRGEFLRGWDDARGLDSGRAIGTFQGSLLGSHVHTGTTSTNGDHSHTHLGVGGTRAGGSSGTVTSDANSNTSTAGAHNHTFTTDATGGAETRPRNVALLACIKF